MVGRWSSRFLMLLVLMWPIATSAQMPAFDQYGVSERYRGRTATLILSGVDQIARAKLRAAARQKPNFAGHYILVTWSCGTECLTGSVIDAMSGKVYSLPVTVCCWNQEAREPLKPIDFRVDSKLLILKGGRNGKACDLGEHYYRFEKDHFDLIKTTSALQCP